MPPFWAVLCRDPTDTQWQHHVTPSFTGGQFTNHSDSPQTESWSCTKPTYAVFYTDLPPPQAWTRAGQSGDRIPVRARFSLPLHTGPGAHQVSYWVFPGGKVAWSWRWPPIPSSTEVRERVELYLYSPSGPSWPALGWNLPLPLPLPLLLLLPLYILNVCGYRCG